MHYSKIAQILLPVVKNSKYEKDVQILLNNDLKSLTQLRTSLKKAINLENAE